MQHVEAGLVGGEPGAHLLHAAEGAHGDAAVRLAAPGTAGVLQAEQLLGCFPDEGLHGVLVAQPVAAGDGVVGVLVEAVVRPDHPGGAPLGRDRVAAHGVDLRHNRNTEFGIDFGGGNCGAQASASATYEKNVMRPYFHGSNTRGRTWKDTRFHPDLSDRTFCQESAAEANGIIEC